eukprot:483139_1
MGNCCQTDATTRELDKKMKEQEEIEENTAKILFLGSGGGGKSTIFKQLGHIYEGSYNVKFDIRLKQKIYCQVIEQMQIAIKICTNQGTISETMDPDDDDNKHKTKTIESIETIQNHSHSEMYDVSVPDIVLDAVQFIWNNCTALHTLMEDMSFKHKILEETTVYFWNDIERIKQSNYVPNDLDFLNLRVKTTGITQKRFRIQKQRFHIFDVGGQVSERNKWIHCFDDVTALLFVVGMSSYNQTMYENSSKNCMVDAMEVFADVCNNAVFTHSHFILFLNKSDIFARKIQKIPITDCCAFNDFMGYHYTEDGVQSVSCNDEYDYAQCCAYMKSKFNVLNKTDNTIYTHFTCALQRDNISHVFKDIQNMILMRQTKRFVNAHNAAHSYDVYQ